MVVLVKILLTVIVTTVFCNLHETVIYELNSLCELITVCFLKT